MMLSCFISLSRLYQGVQKIGHSRCRTRGGGVYWEEFYGYCFMFFSDRFVLFSDDCGAPPQYAIQRGGVCCRVFFCFFFFHPSPEFGGVQRSQADIGDRNPGAATHHQPRARKVCRRRVKCTSAGLVFEFLMDFAVCLARAPIQ